MLAPGRTGFGDAALLTERSPCAVTPTIVFTVAELLVDVASGTAELTLAVSVITVPLAVPAFTLTTIVKIEGVEGCRSGIVQTIVPVPPGLMHVHPAGG